MARQKKAYPEDGKTMFGLSTMGWADTIRHIVYHGTFYAVPDGLREYRGLRGDTGDDAASDRADHRYGG